MQLDFRNINTLWCSILVENLARLGLNTAVVCPGSRSTPLTVAFANHPNIEAIPILDERSAGFFALGIAKRSQIPVALICTSGTAGANFYPAVIEAKESRVPLLILTADRPPELRNCHAGQTIDQVKLYGNYCNFYTELSLPSFEIEMLRYLRQNIVTAWDSCLFPFGGVVHLNCPFREPLAPIIKPEIEGILSQVNFKDFFSNIELGNHKLNGVFFINNYLSKWLSFPKGLIIAGVASSINPNFYCQQIAKLSKILHYPVLAEALSPLRNYAKINPHLITTYDLILRNAELAENLVPDVIIQVGELPTSKELRSWLEKIQPQYWVIDSRPENIDPLHHKTHYIRVAVEDLNLEFFEDNTRNNLSYLTQWESANKDISQEIKVTFEKMNELSESKIMWLVSQVLPEETPLFIANSMSVRYAEFFWMPNDHQIMPYFSRGANGIDGTLSTALGIAHHAKSSILITGDLALLHDTNGFLISQKFQGHLTIILVNNNGGGIFEMLPISQDEALFEDYFTTPQNIDFYQLCQTYKIEHILLKNWQQLKALLNPLPSTGIRMLELQTDRKKDAFWLKNNLSQLTKLSNK
ncbi:2-succinyl-5-enolpyruvyl-6-hydroxy-3-cyclohexene-1-carboxylic-acid synthase [Crocosphaera sp. UHCC 0190]|uniref:2-succinyl-5-enolpyruvyl-6-hydroxy-3- cyclohexene-1-carboxylic-acid synthase n=1 Tax=Crocosphaera sp. UHCC 0190 TaxID=3110246 RepID=UPI002B208517|nr:2-succinyl-5-enolpyruvyl-6-hydroxy-3-cyclohexene-1-carboxylic-acid synthase [Crocosphaera sp. UHCC 0190]MEA5509555.1 2-succinyl-5-enolpyruvyl-6-hydroxy-3-cyclohexene-1-carboxylic-acid synthase [Crocosphaera sp. UHCC 0190]